MDEIIVRIARTIACIARLRILTRLAQSREMTPTDLARELRIPLAMISTHLRRLSSVGLIRRRKSGARCYYMVSSPYRDDAISGRLTEWLRRTLRDPVRTRKRLGLGQLRDDSSDDSETQLHEMLFEAATAFTDLRRLRIMRCLGRGDPMTVRMLTEELSMSRAAANRHLAKLITRGYVQAYQVGGRLVYGLDPKPGPHIHGRLLRIVRDAWEKK